MKELTGLRVLSLEGRQLTDRGVVNLKGLAALQTLDLRGTKVTGAGVEELKKSLPNVSLVR